MSRGSLCLHEATGARVYLEICMEVRGTSTYLELTRAFLSGVMLQRRHHFQSAHAFAVRLFNRVACWHLVLVTFLLRRTVCRAPAAQFKYKKELRARDHHPALASLSGSADIEV